MTVPVPAFVRRWAPTTLGLAALLLAAGCGGSSAEVSGVVTVNGAPLQGGGTVTFEGTAGGASGTIKPDGTYTIPNAPVGEVKVALAPGRPDLPGAGAASMDPSQMKPPQTLAPTTPIPARGNIPPKYADPNTSGLTYQVKGGEQTFDIPLSW